MFVNTGKRVGYFPSVQQLAVWWIDDEVLHILGANGAYQVFWDSEVPDEAFEDLGEL
jgi:hypothetical protein